MELEKDELLKAIEANIPLSTEDRQKIIKAYDFGAKMHKGQKRNSGCDYFKGHPTFVALHLAELKMSPDMIIAGLLHDTIEDTPATVQILKQEFGTNIAFLVKSVSKLKGVRYRNYQRHVASLRRFFVAVAKDVRVLVIKLCDRWHNLETLEFLEPDKRKRIAEGSMLIHGQLASRLNMSYLANAINDLAFPYAYPEEYDRTKKLYDAGVKRADKTIEAIYRDCLTMLSQKLGYKPIVERRTKGLYSLYKKLATKDWQIEAVYDIIAIRIIVKTKADCYQALGLIHGHWQPLLNRVKDYIAFPKTNGYQSIHTTIFGGRGPVVEVQIRTSQMHHFAEYGIAAHHIYKSDGKPSQTFDWSQQLGELASLKDKNISVEDYLKSLKTDFFSNRIFVTTPKGDVVDLPIGATVLDFGFAIHTDIGLRAQGGRINGVFKALKTELSNQDIVEVITSKTAQPTRKWLEWVTTSVARAKLKNHLAISKRPKSQAEGSGN